MGKTSTSILQKKNHQKSGFLLMYTIYYNRFKNYSNKQLEIIVSFEHDNVLM